MSTVAIHNVKTALGGLVRHGYEPDEFLIRAGINPRLITAHHARVGDDQMTALVQLIWNTLGDEFMGFTPSPCKQGAFSMMAHGAYRCSNLREALQFATRFYNFITDDLTMELVETDSKASIRATFSNPELDPDSFFLFFWLIIWHRFFSWLTGQKIPLLETLLVNTTPAKAAELHYLFPGKHRLGSPYNQISFSAEQLNLPLIRDKRELAGFLEQAPAGFMTIPGDDNSLSEQITRLIKISIDRAETRQLTFPSLSEVANQLHRTQITLHRKLKDEGTSYQQIKDDIRRDIALTKLIKDRLKVKQVAEIVGFSESSSFSRAFKDWMGLTPKEYCKFIKSE